MYERSAIVLERYFTEIFGLGKKVNLKTINKDYKELIEEIQKYQDILLEEEEIINDFDEVANDIRVIQQEQKKLYQPNIKLEEERNKLFNSLDKEPREIENKMKTIEEAIDRNNYKLQELRESFIVSLKDFSEKQNQRNQYARNRRVQEKNHLQIIEKMTKDLTEIDISTLRRIKNFINTEEEQEIIDIMIENGKDERVPFNYEVMKDAVMERKEIAKKEAECYILIYERSKRILGEISRDELKIEKYYKILKDVSVKLAFLKAEKSYIVSFLDNERMTSINGQKTHDQLMNEACKNFELDIEQFNNLYELIVKEITGKSTKKAYNELYNKDYLKNINKKVKNFEQEVNGINIKAGTIINSNYWRIGEIKNIYEVFQKEISEKFEKDLSEYQLEDIEQNKATKNSLENNIFSEDQFVKDEYDDDENIAEDYEETKSSKTSKIDEDDEEYDSDYEEYEDEYEDDEYEDDNYEDEDLDDEDDYDDEDFEDEEDLEDDDDYDDEYDDEEEDDDDDYDEYEDNEEEAEDNKGKGLFNKFFK